MDCRTADWTTASRSPRRQLRGAGHSCRATRSSSGRYLRRHRAPRAAGRCRTAPDPGRRQLGRTRANKFRHERTPPDGLVPVEPPPPPLPVDPTPLLSQFQQPPPQLQNLPTGEVRHGLKEQFCDLVCELGGGQDVAQAIVHRTRRRFRVRRRFRGMVLHCRDAIAKNVCRVCLSSPVARHNLKFNPGARSKLYRFAIENRCVQENILATIVRRDEPETACVVKLQNSARSQ